MQTFLCLREEVDLRVDFIGRLSCLNHLGALVHFLCILPSCPPGAFFRFILQVYTSTMWKASIAAAPTQEAASVPMWLVSTIVVVINS